MDNWKNKRKKEWKNEKSKQWKKKGQIKNQKGHEINEMQNWIQNQLWLTSEFKRNIKGKGKEKEKQRKGNKGIHNSN